MLEEHWGRRFLVFWVGAISIRWGMETGENLCHSLRQQCHSSRRSVLRWHLGQEGAYHMWGEQARKRWEGPKDGIEIGTGYSLLWSREDQVEGYGSKRAQAGVLIMKEEVRANTNAWQENYAKMAGMWEVRKARPRIAASPGGENRHKPQRVSSALHTLLSRMCAVSASVINLTLSTLWRQGFTEGQLHH